MKKKTTERKERGSLPGFIVYEAVIIALAIAITTRFCQIGLSLFGLYTVLINAVLAAIGVVVYLAGFGRLKKFFSSKTSWAVILMIIPIIISFIPISGTITKRVLWFFAWDEPFMASISPSLMSTLFAVLLVMAVIIRNNPHKIFSKPSRFILLAEDVLFIASFLNILCNKEPLPIPGITMSCQTLLIFAVIFNWLGIKEVAGIVWIAVLILGVTRLTALDSVMDFTGALYLLSALISGIFQWLELDVHLSLEGFKQQFGVLNNDAADLLKKEQVPSLSKENKQGALPAVTAERADVGEIENDKTTC